MRSLSSSRRGFALAIALAAIVIIGALITGIFFATTQEYRIGRNTALQAKALTAAEYGVSNVMTTSQWKTAWNTSANGLLATIGYAPGDGSVDTVRVTKLNDGMFRITSEGRMGPAGGAQARHRVGALVTLAVPHLNMLAALTTRGSAKVGGSSFLNGSDSSVAGWNCPPKGSNLPGLSLPDTTKLNYAGCHGCIAGNPPVSQNSSAGADSTYFNYGPGLDWNALTAAASKTISGGSTMSTIGPSVSAGSCNTASSTNWGDPLHTDPTMLPCQSYFPIIYAAGNLQLTGGVGQGILLVNGDLTVTGGFQFFGPVIVKGNLSTSGTGGHFNGGVMAANVDLQQNTILGNAVIQFSSCAISKAINGSATPMFAVSRYWTELY